MPLRLPAKKAKYRTAVIIRRRFKAGTSLASLYRTFGRRVVDRAIREAL
jgi:hypothetical protein